MGVEVGLAAHRVPPSAVGTRGRLEGGVAGREGAGGEEKGSESRRKWGGRRATRGRHTGWALTCARLASHRHTAHVGTALAPLHRAASRGPRRSLKLSKDNGPEWPHPGGGPSDFSAHCPSRTLSVSERSPGASGHPLSLSLECTQRLWDLSWGHLVCVWARADCLKPSTRVRVWACPSEALSWGRLCRPGGGGTPGG